jgi:hypothetical protein
MLFNSLEEQSLLIMLLDSFITLINIQLLLQKLCCQSIYSKIIATPLGFEFESMLLIIIHFMAPIGPMIARINDSLISSLEWELIIKIMQKEIFSPFWIWLEPCSFTSLCIGHKRPQRIYGLMQLIKLFTYGIIFQILIPS